MTHPTLDHKTSPFTSYSPEMHQWYNHLKEGLGGFLRGLVIFHIYLVVIYSQIPITLTAAYSCEPCEFDSNTSVMTICWPWTEARDEGPGRLLQT